MTNAGKKIDCFTLFAMTLLRQGFVGQAKIPLTLTLSHSGERENAGHTPQNCCMSDKSDRYKGGQGRPYAKMSDESGVINVAR